MGIRKVIRQIAGLFLVLWLVTGCTNEFIFFIVRPGTLSSSHAEPTHTKDVPQN